MKKTTLFIPILLINLYAIDMPPQIPNIKHQKNKETKKVINDCELIPPMLYRLPFPLLQARDRCESALYMPKKKNIIENFLKKGIKIKKIEIKPLKNCDRFYEIKYWIDKNKTKTIYCNENLKVCFDKKPFKL